MVVRSVPYQAPGQHNKFAPKYEGPYRVAIADANEVTYQIQNETMKKNKMHILQIKKFVGDILSEQSTPTTIKVLEIDWAKLQGSPYSPKKN